MQELPLPLFDQAFLITAIVTFIGGLVRGFSGFGGALVMIPIISLFYNPVYAVVLYALVDVIGVLQMVPTAARYSDWRRVLPMGVAAAICFPLGAYILLIVDEEIMTKTVACIVLGITTILASGWRYKGAPTGLTAAATGGLAGVMGGSTGIGGPPVVIFYLSGAADIPKARASIAGYFIITGMVGLITYFMLGLLTATMITHALLMLPLFSLGVWSGMWLFPRASETVFRRVAYSLLFAVGLTALIA